MTSRQLDQFGIDVNSLTELKNRSGDPSFGIITPITDALTECSAASFKKSDTALRDAYNAGLAKLKANGEFVNIMTKYGFAEQAKITLQAKPTAEECAEK